MAQFAASLETAHDEWAKNGVPKATIDGIEQLVKVYGGVHSLLAMVALYVTKPEDSDEEYPSINFLSKE